MGAKDDNGKTGNSGEGRFGWIKSLGPIGGLIAILAIPFGGYGFYVIDQLRDVEEQNLRTLAKAAGSVESQVETLRKNVENLAKSPGFGCEFQRRQSRLRLARPARCEDLAKLDFVKNGFTMTIESGLDGLQLKMAREDDENQPTQPSTEQQEMTWAIRLDRVLTDIPFGDGMDVLLIADGSGRVVKQHPDPSASPGSVPASGRDSFSGVGLSKRGVRIEDLKKIKPLEDASNLIAELGHGTTIETVLVAGKGYKMLCQPLIFGTPVSGGESQSWVLCGLVEESRALRDALEVAPFLTVSLFALFFFGLFLWPVLKILSMSPRERFRFADVYLLLLGTWGALMLATILVVTIDTYGEFKHQAAISLEQLADDIDDNLSAEVRDIYRQLRAYDRKFNSELGTKISSINATETNDPLMGDLGNQTSLLNHALPPDEETGQPAYPFFSSLFWAEPCSGKQIAKGTIHRKNTPKVYLNQRAYFQKVQADSLWRLPEPANPDQRYYLQTDRSITTGEFFAALSMHSLITAQASGTPAGDSEQDGGSTLENYWSVFHNDERYQSLRDDHGGCGSVPAAAAVMIGQLVSTTNPVLAPGVGFAILDESGDVVFHSDERRAKFENFFDEISEGARLRSVLYAGVATELDTKYRAQPHQAFARQMQQLPWSIVTFLDDDILRTSFMESLLHSVLLMLTHLVFYFLLTFAYLAFIGRSSPVWMWPYLAERASDYRWMAWMLSVVLLGAGLATHSRSDLSLLQLALFMPLLPILVASIGPIIRRQKRSDRYVRNFVTVFTSVAAMACLAISFGGTWSLSMDVGQRVLAFLVVAVWLPGVVVALTGTGRVALDQTADTTATEHRNALSAYMLVAALMWGILAILPAYAYAKLAVNDQISALVKLENLATVRQLKAREETVREYYLPVDMEKEYETERLLRDQKDIYRLSLFYRDDPAADDTKVIEQIETTGRPQQSPWQWPAISANLPIYNETSRDMRYLQRSAEPDESRWMTGEAGQVVFTDNDFSRGQDYKLLSRPKLVFPVLGMPSLLMAALIIGIVFLWSRYGARKLFFGDISPGSNVDDMEALQDFRVFSPRRGLYKKVEPEWVERELETIRQVEAVQALDPLELTQCFASRKEVLDHINALIVDHYNAVWAKRSPEEKLVLVQLAQEGVANPKQAAAVRSLIQCGILFKDPALRIMNQSFALFACSAYKPAELKKDEREHEGINWAGTQKVLFAAIALLLVFLITTQPAAVETLTKFFTGTAASVAAIITLANKFSGFRGGGS